MDELVDGATPLDPSESEGLIPKHIETREELNEWEQENIAFAIRWLETQRIYSSVLSMEFLRELHRRMFGRTWKWAGSFRSTGKTIGVLAHQVPEAVKNLLENTRYQIASSALGPDEIAMRFHHELVRIHPFANGNGRHAREMTDALLRELGREPFSWGSGNIDREGGTRSAYIAALRRADKGDFEALSVFVRS